MVRPEPALAIFLSHASRHLRLKVQEAVNTGARYVELTIAPHEYGTTCSNVLASLDPAIWDNFGRDSMFTETHVAKTDVGLRLRVVQPPVQRQEFDVQITPIPPKNSILLNFKVAW